MKYTITINQKAIVDNKLGIDIIDASIYNYIVDFSKSKKIRKITAEGYEYFWIQYEHLIKEMPMLGLVNKQALKRRIDRLVDCGLLEKYTLHGNSTYFKLGPNYDLLITDEKVVDNEPPI